MSAPWMLKMGRNKDGKLASLKLLGRGLLYAPSSAWWLAGDAAKMLAVGLVTLPLILLAWLAWLVAQVALGCTGNLSEHPVNLKETDDAAD